MHYSGADLSSLEKELEFMGAISTWKECSSDLDWKSGGISILAPRMLVPQMILQPLVENAVRHGIATAIRDGGVESSAQGQNDFLLLQVRNSCEPIQETDGNGVGLRNTRARLKHLYSEDAYFSFVVDRGNSALAELRIPTIRAERQMDEVIPFGYREY